VYKVVIIRKLIAKIGISIKFAISNWTDSRMMNIL